MFPIKRTVFFCTATLVKNTVHLIGNIEYYKDRESGNCIFPLGSGGVALLIGTKKDFGSEISQDISRLVILPSPNLEKF